MTGPWPWSLVIQYRCFLFGPSQGFDCVPHGRLLSKLQSYGIAGKLLDWIEDFLIDRKQRVCIRDSFSEWINVTSGVPQAVFLVVHYVF